MYADGFLLTQRLKDETDKDKRTELIEEINRCAWYALMDRKINEGWLNKLMQTSKINYETISVHLLARILDELS